MNFLGLKGNKVLMSDVIACMHACTHSFYTPFTLFSSSKKLVIPEIRISHRQDRFDYHHHYQHDGMTWLVGWIMAKRSE